MRSASVLNHISRSTMFEGLWTILRPYCLLAIDCLPLSQVNSNPRHESIIASCFKQHTVAASTTQERGRLPRLRRSESTVRRSLARCDWARTEDSTRFEAGRGQTIAKPLLKGTIGRCESR